MSTTKTARYHVRRREFLNEDVEMPAFIIGVVEDTRELPDEPADNWKWGTVVLDLADCSRRVSFDFDLNDADSRSNSLRKINLIAEVVNAVRDAIEIEVESLNKRPHCSGSDPSGSRVKAERDVRLQSNFLASVAKLAQGTCLLSRGL